MKELIQVIIQNKAESAPPKILGKRWQDLADEFNLNQDVPPDKRGEAVRERWKSFKRTKKYRKMISNRDSTEGDRVLKMEQTKGHDEMITISDDSFNLTTREDHIRFYKIDTDIWEDYLSKTNYWEMPSGGGSRIGLHQLKISWRLKERTIERVKLILGDVIKLPPPSKKITNDGSLALEIMITDHHLGKMGFDPQTMKFNWDVQAAAQAYSDAIDYFISRFDTKDVSQIILPTGNDMLNIDSPANMTTRGTPQMAGEFWESLFRYSKDLLIATIDKLESIAPVYVYMVRGNHDRNSVFTLGEVLSTRYSESDNVFIYNPTVSNRQYHKFGKCMIGFTHSDEVSFKNIHKAPAIDEPVMYGQTTHRAVHVGHHHTRKIMKTLEMYSLEEFNGVTVEMCPSLSPVDRWHHNNLYVGNTRQTKMFVWHKDDGVIEEHYWKINSSKK